MNQPLKAFVAQTGTPPAFASQNGKVPVRPPQTSGTPGVSPPYLGGFNAAGVFSGVMTALPQGAQVLILSEGDTTTGGLYPSAAVSMTDNPRNLPTRLGVYPGQPHAEVDVKNSIAYYPLAGDGVTDDTAAIQAVVNAAVGGSASLSAGSYLITSPVVVPANVTLRGAGRASTTILASAQVAAPVGWRGAVEVGNGTTLAGNVVIEGISFNVGAQNAAISLFNYQHVIIRDCAFTGSSTSAYGMITATNQVSGATVMTDLRLRDCSFLNCSCNGVKLNTASGTGPTILDTLVDGCHFEHVYKLAVQVDGQNAIIKDTRVTGNAFVNLDGDVPGGALPYSVAVHAGLAAAYQVADLLVAGNTYTNGNTNQSKSFVQVYQATGVRVIGNYAAVTTGSETDSMFIAPGRVSNPVIGLVVADNYVEGFGSFWDPDSMSQASIHDNVIRNCFPNGGLGTGYNIQQDVDIHDNVLYNSYNNQSSGNFLGAIFLAAPSQPVVRCAIHDNTIIDDRVSPQLLYVIATAGLDGEDTSDVAIVNNRIYVPNGTLTFLHKQNAGNVPPRVICGNEVKQSGGYLYYNPVLATPTVPASPGSVTNTFGMACFVSVNGGTAVTVTVNGLATGTGVVVPPGGTIGLTYTGAPTWTWTALPV